MAVFCTPQPSAERMVAACGGRNPAVPIGGVTASGPILLPEQYKAAGLRCGGLNLFKGFSEQVLMRPAQGNRAPGRGEGFFAAAER